MSSVNVEAPIHLVEIGLHALSRVWQLQSNAVQDTTFPGVQKCLWTFTGTTRMWVRHSVWVVFT